MMQPPVALVLPGAGAHYPRMAAGLYRREPVFTTAADEVFDLLGPAGQGVRADWLSDDPVVPMDHATRSHVLVFVVGYALSRQVMSWVGPPAAVLGHGAGELAAATLCGVFGLADAVELLWAQARGLASAPPGGPLAVDTTSVSITRYLGEDVVLGALDGSAQLVLSGSRAPLARLRPRLVADGFACRPAPATIGFHSSAPVPFVEETLRLVAKIGPASPGIALYSGRTTRRVTAAEAGDPLFWASQPTAPARFWPTLRTLLSDGDFRIVEAGPGRTLTSIAYRHPAVARGRSQAHAAFPARPHGERAERVALRKLARALGT
ncbi:acyltransferase domain-containing protein [Amycolatopsis panacis]|uniref:Acyltransferase domain-containing protein n=1 Tax=Amycolatopsis panacis TaxID=2340917 RepID=A0A419I6L9_9PSEU|nr:acyltransferase domain-containing protein [Amycolatopsis panacis]RJQ87075.1 acyltransferase domain-containing protein [Amycolatopsis panacis]